MILKRLVLSLILIFAIALPCSGGNKDGTRIAFNFVVDNVTINFFKPKWHPNTGHKTDINVTTQTGLKFGIFFSKGLVSIGSNNVFAERDMNYRCMISAHHAVPEEVDLSVLPKPHLNAWNEMMSVTSKLLISNKFWEMISPYFTNKEKKILKRSLNAMKNGKYVPFVMERGKKGYSRIFADIWDFIDTGNICVGYGFGYTVLPMQIIVDDNKIHLITYSGKSVIIDNDPDRITLFQNTKEYRVWIESDRTPEELLQLFEQELKTTKEKIFSLYNEEPTKELLDIIRQGLIGIETYKEVNDEKIFRPGLLRVPSGT